MNELKNWDNKTWLSSSAYINLFNTFLIRKKKLNKNSQILDIGCGRGKIFGALSRKLKLINKPIGIDPVIHKDVDKSIDFKSEDVFKKIIAELGGAIPEEELKAAYNYAIQDPHDNLLVDLFPKCPSKRYRRNLNEFVMFPEAVAQCECKKKKLK